MKPRHLSAAVLVILGLLLAAGLIHLINARFESGDVYRPYSSLRADPLGTKVLFASLQDLPGLEVIRSFRDDEKFDRGAGATLFLFGTSAGALEFTPRDDFERLERFVRSGGRLVLAFYPITEGPTAAGTNEFRKRPGPSRKGAEKKDDAAAKAFVSLWEKWEVRRKYQDLPSAGVAIRVAEDDSLPERISWHTALNFRPDSETWSILYRGPGGPAVIERALGNGRIVMVADSYLASNEALLRERQPAFLRWLVGPGPRIIFDETHLGLAAEEGVATLARKFRLHGLFLSLLVLAVLFVWKNSAPLVPAPEAADAGPVWVAGKDSATAFVNLLRRNISNRELLPVCLAEWKKSGLARRFQSAEKLARAETFLATRADPAGGTVVEDYRALSRLLARREPGKKGAEAMTNRASGESI